MRKLPSSVGENFTLKMLIFCVRTENCYVVVLVDKEHIVSPVRGLNLIIGASLSEPHCYVANRGKRNALWCVRTRNFSTVIKIPSACDRYFYQFVVNLPIVFPSSQLLRQFAWLRISQDASHFARCNLLAELVEQYQ